MVKTCCMCNCELPLNNFKENKRRKDGLQSQCIACQKKYRRQHYIKNRKKYIDKAFQWKKCFKKWWKEYKLNFTCRRCGENHPACVQFHHPNKDKEKAVSEWVKFGNKEKLLGEIKKCIPLCANCHFKEHWIASEAQ